MSQAPSSHDSSPKGSAAESNVPARGPSDRRFLWFGLVVCALLGGIGSRFASTAPDGLNRVAADVGFADSASPTSQIGVAVGNSDPWQLGLLGALGVAITAALMMALMRIAKRRG